MQPQIKLDKTNVLVLVPAFNEEMSVGEVIRAVVRRGFQVLLVSDGSTDSTVSIGHLEGATVLDLPLNLGVGGALRAGFRFACRNGFEAVVQVDADGQHPADGIESLVTSANSSRSDLVIGSRFIGDTTTMEVSFIRRFAMRMLSRSASSAAGVKVTDATSGFRLIRQPLLSEFATHFATNYLGDTYEALISAGRSGFRITEVPALIETRKYGASTASSISAFKFTLKGLGVWLFRFHRHLGQQDR